MWDWVSCLQKLSLQNVPCVIVTVVETHGSTPRHIGAKMIVSRDLQIFGTVGGGALEEKAKEQAISLMENKQFHRAYYPLCVKTKQCCGGAVEFFMEVVGFGPQLVIFGCGHVGLSIAELMVDTPYKIHVVDEREEWVALARPYKHICIHKLNYRAFIDSYESMFEGNHAVIMTHSHELDLEILKILLSKNLNYLGLIGSETKWKRFHQQLIVSGFEQSQLDRVKCPIGLPLGGKSPREVAISFAGQMLQQYYQHQLFENKIMENPIESA